MVIVGRFGSPHGLAGWLRLFSFTQPTEAIFDYAEWQIQIKNSWSPIKMNAVKRQGERWLVQLEGCTDRDVAIHYVNAEIAIPYAQLPLLPKDNFYWADLEGLTALTTTGVELGTVSSLMETGSNDVLVIQGKKQHLVPFLYPQIVTKVDLEKKQLVADWDPEF